MVGIVGYAQTDVAKPKSAYLAYGQFIIPPDVRNIPESEELEFGAVFRVPDVYFSHRGPRFVISQEHSAIDSIGVIAAFIKKHPQSYFQLRRHTDHRGSARYNERLSFSQAELIVRVLAQVFGVDTSKIESIGVGNKEPLIPLHFLQTATSKEQIENIAQHNRRFDLKVVSKKDDSTEYDYDSSKLLRHLGYKLPIDTSVLYLGDKIIGHINGFSYESELFLSEKDFLEKQFIEFLPLIEKLASDDSLKLRFTIHTDHRGNNASNLKLTYKLQQRLIAYLDAKGIDSSKYEVQGMGSNQLLFPKAFIEGLDSKEKKEFYHQLNRRMEVIVLKGKSNLELSVCIYDPEISKFSNDEKFVLIKNGTDTAFYKTDSCGCKEHIWLDKDSNYEIIVNKEFRLSMQKTLNTRGVNQKRYINVFYLPRSHWCTLSSSSIEIRLSDEKSKVYKNFISLLDSIVEFSHQNPGIYYPFTPYIFKNSKKLRMQLIDFEKEIKLRVENTDISEYVTFHPPVFSDRYSENMLVVSPFINDISDVHMDYDFDLLWTSGDKINTAKYWLFENDSFKDSGNVECSNPLLLSMRKVCRYKLAVVPENTIDTTYFYFDSEASWDRRKLYFENKTAKYINWQILDKNECIPISEADLQTIKPSEVIRLTIVEPQSGESAKVCLEQIQKRMLKSGKNNLIFVRRISYEEFIHSDAAARRFYQDDTLKKDPCSYIFIARKKR